MSTNGEFSRRVYTRLMLFFAILLTVFLFAPFSYADAADDAVSPAKMRSLIRQLNHAELAQRDAAEKELIALGSAALEQLPPVSPAMPAEIQHRLTRVRNQIEQAEAEAAVEATRLNITGESLSLDDVLKQIRQQTGNDLFDYRDDFGQPVAKSRLSLKVESQPFWPAVDRMLDDAGLTIYPYTEGGRVGLVSRDPGLPNRVGAAAYSGPFRIEPVSVRAIRDLRNPNGTTMSVGLEIAWEPRLRPVMLKRQSEKFTATGTDGEPIEPGQDVTELQLPIAPGATAVQLDVPLALPPRSLEKISELKGELEAIVPGKLATFEFSDLESKKTQSSRQAGAIVTLDSVRKNNDLWEIRVRLKFDDTSGALASHHGWVYDNRCFLKSPDGTETDNAAFERYAESENEVGVGYLFDIADLKKKTLVYITPAAINRLQIEFSLKDLPLP